MKRLSVLVADDNHDDTATWALLIRMRGHRVRTASDGAEALRLAEEEMPDVALLDIEMPHVDGASVAKKLRQRSPGFSPLLVAVTGWGGRAGRKNSYDDGFDLHFTKPADPDRMMTLFERFGEIAAYE